MMCEQTVLKVEHGIPILNVFASNRKRDKIEGILRSLFNQVKLYSFAVICRLQIVVFEISNQWNILFRQTFMQLITNQFHGNLLIVYQIDERKETPPPSLVSSNNQLQACFYHSGAWWMQITVFIC